MARPKKQTVDYFPHDAGASDGDTLTILQNHFGNDGYAFWFKLLEKISSSENHIIDCRNSKKWQLLLAKTRTNQETGIAIMDMLCELEAIDAELWRGDKVIWCQKLVDNVADVYKNRNSPVPERPIPTDNNGISIKHNSISITDNTQSKVKETIIIPDWINKETWGAFLEMRKIQRAVPTERAKVLLIKDLERLKLAGNDPNEVLNRSIMNSWKGVFPLDKQGGTDGTNRKNPRQIIPRTQYTKPEDY